MIQMNKLGRLLSAMVFQNIAAMIAVGIIRSLFGVYGWWPNDRIFLLVDPMLNELIPLLLAYTGGRLLGGQRGAVVASVITLGLALASSVPMILGAMIIGPLIGWLVRELDKLLEDHLPVGFELLVSNFLCASLAVILTILSFTYVGQTLSAAIIWLNNFLQMVINSGWLPVASLVIEPAKVFFFNNVINHGVLSPLGIQQAKDLGKSIFFLMETNPGPGLGLLFAYLLKTRGEQLKTVKLTMIIHIFGGIQEVYFPFVLMNPLLFIAVIAGGMTGIAVFQYLDAGLVATPSPSSILILVALAPRGDILSVLIGVILSSLVSFGISFMILKSDSILISKDLKLGEFKQLENLQHIQVLNESKNLDTKQKKVVAFKDVLSKRTTRKEETDDSGKRSELAYVRKIIFACDAGMGSSAMGAAMLKKKLKAVGLEISVDNSSVDDIPEDADLIITHKNLTQRAIYSAPSKEHVSLDSFTDISAYDRIVSRLEGITKNKNGIFITENQIFINCEADTEEEAIKLVGQHMVQLGYIKPNYIEEMLMREKIITTYIGYGIAIPHGIDSQSPSIIKSGIVIARFPKGVNFKGETANLLIGIAGKGETHVKLLSAVANVLEEPDLMQKVIHVNSKADFLSVFHLLNEVENEV
jgi:mannitol PTS system EIICBA or EIICB component